MSYIYISNQNHRELHIENPDTININKYSRYKKCNLQPFTDDKITETLHRKVKYPQRNQFL